MKLYFRPYLRYKFFNALFTGMVGGSVFTIYATLSPSTFSIGGILLALGMMGMAYLYHRLMNIRTFFRFTLASELIMLLMVGYYLLFSSNIMSALVIYVAYQFSFIFGGYLVRAETHFARHARMMGWIDIAKQQGSLAGLALSYGFYKLLEHYGITKAAEQVYNLHFILLALEILIIVFLIRSFRRR
jgi:putative membrane protein